MTGRALCVLAALVCACGDRTPTPEQVCAHHDTLFQKEIDGLAPKGAPSSERIDDIVEEVRAQHEASHRTCVPAFKEIYAVAEPSKWKKFAECDLAATTTKDLERCPEHLK